MSPSESRSTGYEASGIFNQLPIITSEKFSDQSFSYKKKSVSLKATLVTSISPSPS